MRVVLDTNTLVSALISPAGSADRLYIAWKDGRYSLVTSHDQLEEFRRVSRYARVKAFIAPGAAGTFYNHLRTSELLLDKLPTVTRSIDPAGNFLLAMAEAGSADYLVTGDKRDVLALGKHGNTQIVSARNMLRILGIAGQGA